MLQNIADIQTCLCGDCRTALSGNTDDVFDFRLNTCNICRGKVDLIDDGQNFKVVVNGKERVCQRLCFNTLCRVDDENGAFTCIERTGNLVGEVNVAGSVDQVEGIGFAVLGFVVEMNGTCFDRDAAFTLNVHIIEQLLFHVTLGDGFCFFQQSVSERGLTVVDMCDDTKISDMILIWHVRYDSFCIVLPRERKGLATAELICIYYIAKSRAIQDLQRKFYKKVEFDVFHVKQKSPAPDRHGRLWKNHNYSFAFFFSPMERMALTTIPMMSAVAMLVSVIGPRFRVRPPIPGTRMDATTSR